MKPSVSAPTIVWSGSRGACFVRHCINGQCCQRILRWPVIWPEWRSSDCPMSNVFRESKDPLDGRRGRGHQAISRPHTSARARLTLPDGHAQPLIFKGETCFETSNTCVNHFRRFFHKSPVSQHRSDRILEEASWPTPRVSLR